MITPNSLLKMKVDFNKGRGYSIAAGMSKGVKKNFPTVLFARIQTLRRMIKAIGE